MPWKRRWSGAATPIGARTRLSQQVHALGTDRSKLASDLDAVTARSRKLEAANREIAQRLDVAIDSIRQVIEAQP